MATSDGSERTVYKVVCSHCRHVTPVRPNLAAEEAERLRALIGNLYATRTADAAVLRRAIRHAFGEARS